MVASSGAVLAALGFGHAVVVAPPRPRKPSASCSFASEVGLRGWRLGFGIHDSEASSASFSSLIRYSAACFSFPAGMAYTHHMIMLTRSGGISLGPPQRHSVAWMRRSSPSSAALSNLNSASISAASDST